MLWSHQPAEQRCRRGVGNDDLAVKLAPVGHTDTARTSCIDQHLRHRRVGQNLHAEALAGSGYGASDGSHASADEAPASGALMLAHQMVHDHVGGARRFRAGKSADRRVVGEHRLDHVALEPHRQVVVGALTQQIDQPVSSITDGSVPPQQCGGLLEILPAAPDRIDRGLEQQFPHQPRGLLELPRELRIDFRIVAREAGEFRLRLADVVAIDDVVVAAERTEQIVGRQYLETERLQLEIADHPGVQQAHHVREPGAAEPRAEFFRDCRSADDIAAFEYERLQAGFGEVGTADQPVVAGPDDDDIEFARHATHPASLDMCHRPGDDAR